MHEWNWLEWGLQEVRRQGKVVREARAIRGVLPGREWAGTRSDGFMGFD